MQHIYIHKKNIQTATTCYELKYKYLNVDSLTASTTLVDKLFYAHDKRSFFKLFKWVSRDLFGKVPWKSSCN